MPNWNDIQQEWETTDISFPELAKKHGVKLSTVKSRKQRMGWTRGTDATGQKIAAKKMQPDATETENLEFDGLTQKQRDFCIYYIKSFNQTMAAIKAGYSPKSAHVEASRMIRNPKIIKEIKRLKGEVQQSLFLDAQDILMMYVKIAMADITDFVRFGKETVQVKNEITGNPLTYENGEPVTYERNKVDFVDWDKVDGTIISEVKQGRDGISVKLADKHKAMDFLAKHFDMVPDQFKRQLEVERLKLERDKTYGIEEKEEFEDDGFMDALDQKTEDVWGDERDS